MLKSLLRQKRTLWSDCCGPDGSGDTKIGQIGWCHIVMSYAHMTSNVTYDAYDIKIWHQPFWPIWVSKEPSGPQQSHFWVGFCLKKYFNIQKWKIESGNFFLYKFWKSFVFWAPKIGIYGKHFLVSLEKKIYVSGILVTRRMGLAC